MLTELLDGGPDGESRPGAYLAEVIYGANDGIVTTFAVVAGVAGAAFDPAIVVVLGVANLLADGVSMGMSNYLSRRSEIDYERSTGGAVSDERSPRRTALATFGAFVVAGWTPLLPYVLALQPPFGLSIAATGVAFFGVGAGRSLVTDRSPLSAGVEMLVVGAIAASVAFAAGALLSGVA